MMEREKIEEYLEKAIKIREKAYTPYSKFKVGAIVVDQDENEYVGVNVENSSYGLSNCAERTAIFTAVTNGMKTLKLLVVVGDTEGPVSPCGACRQVMKEFATEETIIVMGNLKKEYKIMSIEEILPYGFKF